MFPDQSGMAIEARYAPAEDDLTKITARSWRQATPPRRASKSA
jgi:hypothetical protein